MFGNPEKIKQAFLEYYMKLLGSESVSKATVSRTIVNQGSMLNEAQQTSLCREFTREDVKVAPFAIDDNKVVGPDGFSSGFFMKTWSIIGSDIIAAVLDFFHTGKLLKQVDATTLCLIPKCEQADDVTKYRPIACCNVMYKIISKMICSRLKCGLLAIMKPVQSAFIENRIIMHNIFLCQDIMKNYLRKSLPARCTIKVDLRKAYDSLNWEFVKELLIALKFPHQFVHWVMLCITSPCFSLSFNGGLCGFFKGKQGLRQGDLMSTLIFVIAMEYLSRLLKKMSLKNSLSFLHRCTHMQINHLIFADDLMMFCKGNASSMTDD